MRLNEIFAMIPPTDTFADIGCDHGLLCLMVLKGNKAKRILAADISKACLSKAQALMGKNAEYFLGDGLNALGDLIPDVTVISGMGGNTILHILDKRILPKVIISPQNDVYKVRKTLTESGYKITEDKLVVENGKFYNIIALEPGKMILDELQLTFGAFYKRNDSIFVTKLKRDKERLLGYKQTPQNIQKLMLINRAMENLPQEK